MELKKRNEGRDSKRTCLLCHEKIVGRSDKKFCDDYCRTRYNYNKAKETPALYTQIYDQLKLNRKLLRHFNRGGIVHVRKEVLTQKGFNPHFFTHYWKNSKGDVYLFCFEYGFLKKVENGSEKYILILWQTYMSPPVGIV